MKAAGAGSTMRPLTPSRRPAVQGCGYYTTFLVIRPLPEKERDKTFPTE
jgi:hypothetical protein